MVRLEAAFWWHGYSRICWPTMWALSGLLAFLTYSSGCQSMATCPGGVSVSNGTACAACDSGFADCNGDPMDGCEVKLDTDTKNCGSCGKICPGTAAQQAACYAGACTDCPIGSQDCNGRGDDGCETLVSSDLKNCGACGKVCPTVPFAPSQNSV